MEVLLSKRGKTMLLTKDILIALSESGLNKYEAKVYLTLITEGISTAKNISDITAIPYGKVYEIINVLASKGFVIILPTKPMKCQAISPKESITSLKKNYQEKIEKFENIVIKELEPMFAKSKRFVEPQGIFWVMKGRANINKKVEDMITKARKQICIFTSENGLKRLGFHKDILEETKRNKVEILVAGKISENNLEDIKPLDFCEFRHIDEVPSHFISIDRNECMLIEPMPDDEEFAYGRDLAVLISNSSFTKFLDDSFMSVFSKAQTLNDRLDEINTSEKIQTHQ